MINPSLSNSRKLKAFTLVELLVVIAIIGILAAILGGAGIKWMAWQRDPTNPNSNVSLTINNIKQAVTRITQDIQQKAKTDYQALSPAGKALYQIPSNFTEPDPNARAILVYANTQIVKNFPTLVAGISATMTTNTIWKNAPVAASTPNRNSSAWLLVALESHPKGLKVEDLGSGVISNDGSSGPRIIQAGSTVIYHKIHYVELADYNLDKSFKVGSVRVDITYDTE